MKIIQVDNFDRDVVSDELIVIHVTEEWGKRLVELMNNVWSGDNAPFFYKLVSDDHKLYVYDPT